MKFDIDSARKAGYSDDEIADYLATQNKFDLSGAIESGYTAQDVIDFLSKPAANPQRDLPAGVTPSEGRSATPMGRDDPRLIKQEPPKRALSDVALDTGITLLKGAIGLPEAFVGLADIPTQGRIGKFLEERGYRPREAKEILDTYLSEAQQAANRKVQEADGFMPTVKTALENPSTIVTTVGESLPQMLGGAGIARGLIKAAPKVAPVVAGAIGEGAIGAGSAASQIRGQNEDGLLTGKQAASALGSGVGTALLGVAGGKTAQKLGFDDIDTMLAAGSGTGGTKSVADFVKRLGAAGFTEGVLEEMPQSAQEQIWQNYALDRPFLEGVGNAAGMGLVTGAAMGMAGGGIGGIQRSPASQVARAMNQEIANTEFSVPAREVAADLLSPNAYDQRLISPTETARPGQVVNFTEPDSATAQAGLTPIVVPVPAAPATEEVPTVGQINPETERAFGLDQLRMGVTNVGTTGVAGRAAAGGSQPAGDLSGAGVGDAGLAGVDAAGASRTGAGGVAPVGGEAAPLGGASGQQPAGVTPQGYNNAVAEPVEQWFGRKGDGYSTEADAQQALPGRQRMFKDLDWKIEPMPNGKFRLAGYSQETDLGTQAPQAIQAEAQGQEAAAAGTTAAAAPQTGQPQLPAPRLGAAARGLSLAPTISTSEFEKFRRSEASATQVRDSKTGVLVSSGIDVQPISINQISNEDLRDQHTLASAVARVLKKTYTVSRVVSGNATQQSNGMTTLGGKHIVVAENATDAPLFVMMHEAWHNIPEAERKEVNQKLLQLFKQNKRQQFLSEFGYNDQDFDEEAPAMIVQALSKQPEFWDELRVKVGNKEFSSIAKRVLDALSDIIAKLSGRYGKDFVNTYLRDAVKARDLLTTAYAKALRDQGVTPDLQSDIAQQTGNQPILQNRNRATPSSIAQMQSIAASPDYGRLGFSRDFANGAPVVAGGQVAPEQLGRQDVAVASDGRRIPVQYAVVEAADVLPSNQADGTPNPDYGNQAVQRIRAIAGNGRIAGLQRAYSKGTTANYINELVGDNLHGVSPEVIRRMRAPVLVRVMPTDQVTADIGDVSNTVGNLNLSAVEQAGNDAQRVNLDALQFAEDGSITPEAVRQFVRAMPQAEQGGLIDTNGQPTKQAVDRINAAVFARAYGNDQLIRLFAQAQDPEARNVLSALAQVAPKMARLEGAGALDIRDVVTQAAEIAVNTRREGKAIARAAQQLDMAADPMVGVVLDLFAANPRSVKPVVEALSNAADLAYTEATKPAEDMFGAVPRASRTDVINQLRPQNERASQENLEQPAGRESVQVDAGRAQAKRAAASGPAATQASRPAEEEGLTAYTPEEVTQRLERLEQAERERQQQDREAEQRAQADAERDTFTLTGSDRAADVAAAQGQTDIFSSRRSGKDTSAAEAVPAGQELIAIHNLTTENLLYADKIGGLPVPSIGITKSASPFNAFGNITLLAPKGMIDPATGTPVFDRDAYTSRFPELNYKKVPIKKADAFYNEMKVTRQLGDDGDAFMQTLWEGMTGSSASPDKVIGAFDRYNAPKILYAKEVLGKTVKAPMRDVRTDYAWVKDKKFIAEATPLLEKLRDMSASDVEESSELKTLVATARARIFAYVDSNPEGKKLSEALGRNDAIESLAASWGMDGAWAIDESQSPGWKFPDKVRKSISDAGKREVDGAKLTEQIRKLVPYNDPAYLAWAKSKTAGLFDQPTIKVGGKQVAPTLNNIVAAMTTGATAGAEKTMTSGVGKTSAMLGKRFKSLDEIKAARDQVVSTAKEGEVKKGAEKLLSEYRDKALEFFTEKNWRGDVDTWAGMDASMEALALAGKGALTDGNVRVALQRKGFRGMDQQTIDLAKQGVEALRSAVTDYFEAKPQRAVALSEFRGAVVPKGADPKALEVLAKNNIETVEYNPKKEGDREAKLQKLAKKLDKAEGDIMFSRRATIEVDGVDRPTTDSNGQQIHPTEEGIRNFWRWFGDSKVVDENGEPLVVYHGTRSDFGVFDKSKIGTGGTFESARLGFFFSRNPNYASAMAAGEGAPNVMPVYLSIKNPLEVTTTELTDKDEVDALIAKAKKGGHDGIIDYVGNFVVFRPEQIKSATGNSGTFDPEDPDIRRSNRVRQDADVVKMFEDLQNARGLKLIRAQEAIADHPMGEQIAKIHNDFYDILERLDEAGLIEINCK